MKVRLFVIRQQRHGGFHCRKAVAPLKGQWPLLASRTRPTFPLPKGGGPIEGGGQSQQCAFIALRDCFHCRKAVAPLKAYCSTIALRVWSGFHCRKAVAPLKGLISGGPTFPAWSFPLPKGGGPIEGRTLARRLALYSRVSTVLARFHCRKAVAPLRGAQVPEYPHSRRKFPLPKGGGPIEGGLSINCWRPSCRFHCRKAVAPLKRFGPSNQRTPTSTV